MYWKICHLLIISIDFPLKAVEELTAKKPSHMKLGHSSKLRTEVARHVILGSLLKTHFPLYHQEMCNIKQHGTEQVWILHLCVFTKLEKREKRGNAHGQTTWWGNSRKPETKPYFHIQNDHHLNIYTTKYKSEEELLGWVFWKPVNANPGLKVNQILIFLA